MDNDHADSPWGNPADLPGYNAPGEEFYAAVTAQMGAEAVRPRIAVRPARNTAEENARCLRIITTTIWSVFGIFCLTVGGTIALWLIAE